jgi:hypothetical protein
MPGARRTAASCAKIKSTRVSHHGHTGITRHSPRNGFTAYSALFPVIGLVVTVISGILPANLTPASRRQNHTISPSASRAVRPQHIRVHRIPPRVRDDREPPLEWDETKSLYCCFYPGVKRDFGNSEIVFRSVGGAQRYRITWLVSLSAQPILRSCC